jgi:hypothetical protein
MHPNFCVSKLLGTLAHVLFMVWEAKNEITSLILVVIDTNNFK